MLYGCVVPSRGPNIWRFYLKSPSWKTTETAFCLYGEIAWLLGIHYSVYHSVHSLLYKLSPIIGPCNICYATLVPFWKRGVGLVRRRRNHQWVLICPPGTSCQFSSLFIFLGGKRSKRGPPKWKENKHFPILSNSKLLSFFQVSSFSKFNNMGGITRGDMVLLNWGQGEKKTLLGNSLFWEEEEKNGRFKLISSFKRGRKDTSCWSTYSTSIPPAAIDQVFLFGKDIILTQIKKREKKLGKKNQKCFIFQRENNSEFVCQITASLQFFLLSSSTYRTALSYCTSIQNIARYSHETLIWSLGFQFWSHWKTVSFAKRMKMNGFFLQKPTNSRVWSGFVCLVFCICGSK